MSFDRQEPPCQLGRKQNDLGDRQVSGCVCDGVPRGLTERHTQTVGAQKEQRRKNLENAGLLGPK